MKFPSCAVTLRNGDKPWHTSPESIKKDASICGHHADPGTALASGTTPTWRADRRLGLDRLADPVQNDFSAPALEKPLALLLLKRVQHGAGYRAHHVAASVDTSTSKVIDPGAGELARLPAGLWSGMDNSAMERLLPRTTNRIHRAAALKLRKPGKAVPCGCTGKTPEHHFVCAAITSCFGNPRSPCLCAGHSRWSGSCSRRFRRAKRGLKLPHGIFALHQSPICCRGFH